MTNTKTQILFFQHIKSVLSPHLSFVDEVASVLNISNDSAYRRIRGEKLISIDEIQALSNYFKISIDQFLHLTSTSFLFSGDLATAGEHVFEKWMNNIYNQLNLINSFPNKHLYYLAKDLPIMNQFMSAELLTFKSFLWRRSILHDEDIKNKKFSLADIIPEHLAMGKKIESVYAQIPSTEIWNLESINSTIRQIEFYREADMFSSEEDIRSLYIAVLKVIDHLEQQAETGKKFISGTDQVTAAPYHLLWNDLVLGDNTVMFDMGERKITILNHSVINFIHTTDERFNNYIFNMIQNLSKRSTQLSIVGEKERSRFFSKIREKILAPARL